MSERLRVLEISARSDLGGGPKHLADLLTQWHKLGSIDAWVAAPSEGDFAAAFQEHCRGFVPLPHRKLSFSALGDLRTLCRTQRIEIIHSHGKGAGIFSRILGLRTGLPVVHTFHGLHEPITSKERVYRPIEAVLAHQTAAYIAVSASEKDVATRAYGLPGAKIQVVYNGVNASELASGNPSYREGFAKSPSSETVFGILSRLEEFPKNIGAAIRSFASTPPNLKILIAGDGPDAGSYRDLVRELGLDSRVKFLGAIRDVPNFLSSIDVYASFSSKEGLPYALLEASAVHLPALLTDIPPHREIAPARAHWVKDGALSADDWTRAALLTMDSASRPDSGRYSIERMAEETAAVLRSVSRLAR